MVKDKDKDKDKDKEKEKKQRLHATREYVRRGKHDHGLIVN